VSEITGPLKLIRGVFEITCEDSGWLESYLQHHSERFRNDVGFFHLHQWLTSRGIRSQHRIAWAGWRSIGEWISGSILMILFPLCKKDGTESVFYDSKKCDKGDLL
jgi:hypothetical protein